MKQRGPPADEWAKRPMIEHFSSPHPMVHFRAEGVVNHDTFMYGVVRPEIGTTLKDGVAIYHPIGRYEFHERVFQSGTQLLRTMDVV